MRPLFWKEVRDLRWWVAGTLVLVAGLALACRLPSMERSMMSDYLVTTMPAFSIIAAVGLAVGQVARERHTRTLEFLLVRPIAPAAIVWTKFLAGTLALLLVLTALVGLGFLVPARIMSTSTEAVRSMAGFWSLLTVWLSRYWLLYAAVLVCSTFVSGTGKSLALAGVFIVTSLALTFACLDLAPFSGIEWWLSVFDGTGGLMRVVRDPVMLWLTSGVFCAAVLLAAFATAKLFARSPERHLHDRTYTSVLIAVVPTAGLFAFLLDIRLPVTMPTGSVAFNSNFSPKTMAADRGLVCVVLDDGLMFLDFSNPARAKKAVQMELPLWNTSRITLADGVAYLVGKRKSVPVDELQVVRASLTAAGTIELASPIPLGPPDASDFIGSAIPVGRYLYVSAIVRRQCRVRVFDLAGGGEVAGLTVDTLHNNLHQAPNEDPKGSMTMRRRGEFLYVASPSALTTIDVAEPGALRVASRLGFQESMPLLYGFARDLTPYEGLLLEPGLWPQVLRTYSLSDPRKPVPAGEFDWHRTGGSAVVDTGATLCQPWREGVITFRRKGAGLEALRHLKAGYNVDHLAAADGWVYTMGYDETVKQNRVTAFRVGSAAR
jgi:ABC-type transport system involved in multi-copper enzyme maturation permease subunit